MFLLLVLASLLQLVLDSTTDLCHFSTPWSSLESRSFTPIRFLEQWPTIKDFIIVLVVGFMRSPDLHHITCSLNPNSEMLFDCELIYDCVFNEIDGKPFYVLVGNIVCSRIYWEKLLTAVFFLWISLSGLRHIHDLSNAFLILILPASPYFNDEFMGKLSSPTIKREQKKLSKFFCNSSLASS